MTRRRAVGPIPAGWVQAISPDTPTGSVTFRVDGGMVRATVPLTRNAAVYNSPGLGDTLVVWPAPRP